ncbi:centromere protein I-like isoform X2 [Portunus trituberculatus]|nr:centromere protein I-like isoform X2 [Portunus trituberculatus]XP_045129978.1 centromere protein I-like isoform X2 [Portunus trituberculatus]
MQVVPLAVSSASVKDVSVPWQYAVLCWLEGMLEFGIIQSSEPLIHICYTTVFNLLSSLTLSSIASRLLYHMTVRQDVTPNRVQVLLKLRLKPGFNIPASFVLRLYNLFRPDLVTGQLADRTVVKRLPPALKTRLLEARMRLQGEAEYLDTVEGKDRLWRDGAKLEKMNLHLRNTAVPLPYFNMCTLTVEEKKMRPLYATQYQSFSEMVRGMSEWERWVWPSNPAAHLACPLVVPLFRAHQVQVQVGLTNWLEVALRTELVEGIGAPSKERQDSLLNTAHELCFSHAASLPVISNFLLELMPVWNHSDNFKKVVRLLEFVGFTSTANLSPSVLRVVEQLMLSQPLIVWCRVVESVTAMVCRWLITEHQERTSGSSDGHDWPQQEEYSSALTGAWFVTKRLERMFLFGVLEYESHPLVIHHILDYYTQVDMYCEELNLPMSVYPPPILTLNIVGNSDLALTHRLGHILARVKDRLATLTKMNEEGCEEQILILCLQGTSEVNESVFIFISGLLEGTALSKFWEKSLDKFYPFEHLKKLRARKHIGKFASVTHALPFLPFVGKALTEMDREWTQAEFKKVRADVLADLSAAGLTGIEACHKAYSAEVKQEEVEGTQREQSVA